MQLLEVREFTVGLLFLVLKFGEEYRVEDTWQASQMTQGQKSPPANAGDTKFDP